MVVLLQTLGQITEEESLFSYPGNLSTANFSFPDHVPRFVDEVLGDADEATVAACNGNARCIFDATQTGNLEIGMATMQTEETNQNDQMQSSKLKPEFGTKLCIAYRSCL